MFLEGLSGFPSLLETSSEKSVAADHVSRHFSSKCVHLRCTGLTGVIHQSGIRDHPVLKYHLRITVSSDSRPTECVIDILTIFHNILLYFLFYLFLPLCSFLDLALVQLYFSLVSDLLLSSASEFLLWVLVSGAFSLSHLLGHYFILGGLQRFPSPFTEGRAILWKLS